MQIYNLYLCKQIGYNFIINRFSRINKRYNSCRFNLINKALQPVCGLLFFIPIVNKYNNSQKLFSA